MTAPAHRPTTPAEILTAGALDSVRLPGGRWAHRLAPAPEPSRPLLPGESAKVNGRWFHAPLTGGTR